MQIINLIYWLKFVSSITPWLHRNCKTNVDMQTLVQLYSSMVEIHNHETQQSTHSVNYSVNEIFPIMCDNLLPLFMSLTFG